MRADASQSAASSLRLRPVSDERLVARLRGGDARAFEAIYDRYERPIRSFCRHMVGQAEDADDAAQHTFLAAYRELVGSDKRIDLRPWLFTIARNRCRTLLRARYRGMAFSESMDHEPSVEGLAVEVERREQLRDLMRDIARLPEDQRAALLLTQLDTLHHDEVARVLEVPPEKVKALVFQARSSLVASELARETPCREIRQQLATLRGAGLRRRNLRRHLRDCPGCREFEARLRRQRQAILVLLPVAASPAVRDAVAGQLLGGGGGAAAGGIAAGGGGAAGGSFGGFMVNAVAIKSATVLTVAALGGGAATVTVGVRAVGALDQASGGGQSATLVSRVGAPPPPVYRPARSDQVGSPPAGGQPRTHRDAPSHPGEAHPTPTHAVPGDKPTTVVLNAGIVPAAPVADHQTGADSQTVPGQAKQNDSGAEAPGQTKKQEPDSAPPGQANQPASGSVPPGQANKPDPPSAPPGQGNKPDSGSVPPGQGKKPESAAPPQPQGNQQQSAAGQKPGQAKKPDPPNGNPKPPPAQGNSGSAGGGSGNGHGGGT